jgi:hypothetical protein
MLRAAAPMELAAKQDRGDRGIAAKMVLPT